MRQFFVTAVISTIMAASPAFAGGSMKDAPAPVAHERGCASGPFAGAVLGGTIGVARSDFSHTVGEGAGTGDYTSYSSNILSTDNNRAAIGGIGGSYNWQCDRFVMGIAADLNFGNVNAVVDYGDGDKLKASLNHFGTVRAKAGIAHENVLFYLTGGLAFGKFDYELSGCCTASNSLRDTGFVYGAGLELDRGRWSLSAELLRVDFGSTKIDYALTTCTFECNVGTKWDNAFTVVRLGVNFKLQHDEPVRHHPVK